MAFNVPDLSPNTHGRIQEYIFDLSEHLTIITKMERAVSISLGVTVYEKTVPFIKYLKMIFSQLTFNILKIKMEFKNNNTITNGLL